MSRGYWAWIQPVQRQGGHPDQGLPGGGGYPDQGLPGGEYPDQGLPGRPPGFWGGERPSWPGHPGHLPARPERPIDPGYGWGGPERPGHGLPQPPHLWPRPPGGGLPVDPGWGVGEEHPDQGPVYPVGPGNELPPVEGIEPPPVDPPPGTVWPPLPPDVEVSGKAIVLAAIQGVGYRYIVIEISPPAPDQGLPGEPQPQPKRHRS